MNLGYESKNGGPITLRKIDRVIPAETFESWSKKIAAYQERSKKVGRPGNQQDGEVILEWAGKIVGDLSVTELLAPLSFSNLEGAGRSRHAFFKERDAKVFFVHVCLIEATKIFAALGNVQTLRQILMQASGRDASREFHPIHEVQKGLGAEWSPDIVKNGVVLLKFHSLTSLTQHAQFYAAEEFAQEQLLRAAIKGDPKNIDLELRTIAAEMHFATGMTPNRQRAERLVQLLDKGVAVDPKDEHYAEAMNGLLDQLLGKEQPSALVEIKIAQQRQAIRT